ncbi:recombinase family protein [Streptomyces xanthochromogenes]|uniref:recombinase family protein n=1 Tax=Streptomyces xanthochromogenes TaxID=67384 RepID=UPI0037B5A181
MITAPPNTKRAIGAVRLSVSGVGQTGDDTQKRRISKQIDADELTFVGFAEDIDVSASLSPWLRPSLGDWLNNRRDEFDVIYVYKIDRIARSTKDLCMLLEWCDEHGKTLVSVEERFDFSSDWGRMVAKLLAVLAEGELNAIRARIRASREAMREAGRWPGGLVPFGRVAARDGDGYTLALCPEYGPVLLEMIRLFIATKSFGVVADWLTAGGVPTAQDIARVRAADASAGTNTRLDGDKAKARGSRWSSNSVQAILVSRSLLGEYVRTDGTVVRNTDGTPVMRGVPVLEESEWLTLQETVALVKYTKGPSEVSPVRGIIFCDGSDYEHPLYWARGGTRNGKPRQPRIRCQGHVTTGRKPCPGHSWNAERLYSLIGATLRLQIGSAPVMERKAVQGDDTAVRIAVLDAQADQLMKEHRAGKLSRAAYRELEDKVLDEREALTNAPQAKPVDEWVATGQTYGEWWDAASREERREKLISWGVKLYAGTSGVRFEYGENFPAKTYIAAAGLGSMQPPTDRVAVIDPGTKTIEITDTRTGEVSTLPLPWGERVALAA